MVAAALGGGDRDASPERLPVCGNGEANCLRTNRPYRAAWDAEKVVKYIEEKAGSEFEPEIAGKFIEMMRTLEGRVARVEYPEGAGAALVPAVPGDPAAFAGPVAPAPAPVAAST